jgi:hypothetical protein
MHEPKLCNATCDGYGLFGAQRRYCRQPCADLIIIDYIIKIYNSYLSATLSPYPICSYNEQIPRTLQKIEIGGSHSGISASLDASSLILIHLSKPHDTSSRYMRSSSEISNVTNLQFSQQGSQEGISSFHWYFFCTSSINFSIKSDVSSIIFLSLFFNFHIIKNKISVFD